MITREYTLTALLLGSERGRAEVVLALDKSDALGALRALGDPLEVRRLKSQHDCASEAELFCKLLEGVAQSGSSMILPDLTAEHLSHLLTSQGCWLDCVGQFQFPSGHYKTLDEFLGFLFEAHIIFDDLEGAGIQTGGSSGDVQILLLKALGKQATLGDTYGDLAACVDRWLSDDAREELRAWARRAGLGTLDPVKLLPALIDRNRRPGAAENNAGVQGAEFVFDALALHYLRAMATDAGRQLLRLADDSALKAQELMPVDPDCRTLPGRVALHQSFYREAFRRLAKLIPTATVETILAHTGQAQTKPKRYDTPEDQLDPNGKLAVIEEPLARGLLTAVAASVFGSRGETRAVRLCISVPRKEDGSLQPIVEFAPIDQPRAAHLKEELEKLRYHQLAPGPDP